MDRWFTLSSAEQGRSRPERADAARNRRAILQAAEDLLQRYDPAQVSVERVAAKAGVGKATVFHRFGSRSGLMGALMAERAEALRLAALSGPPPLGPGAPPRDRLLAFTNGIIDLAARNIGLLTAQDHAAQTSRTAGATREAHPVYEFWHGHVAGLISAARPDLDADLLAHILLGVLHTEPVARLLRSGEAERVGVTVRQVATALLDMATDPAGAVRTRSARSAPI
jgi:AcrR family transcriptional regulator